MTAPENRPTARWPPAIPILTFAVLLALRVRGVSRQFWLLGDQIRDWSIALSDFRDLPLVGPPTHVHGYTIGPAFYWILWAIRVTFGPWFHNLPHAGGIGQAVMQSAADALLLVAICRRTRSPWIAAAAIVLIATAAYDLCLAPLVWNPVMGSILAKTAIALVLLGWGRGGSVHVALTAALAWAGVHAYTGVVFVALGVFAALILQPAIEGHRAAAWRHLAIIVVVVVALQLPLVLHQMSTRYRDQSMGAVTGSLVKIAQGEAAPQFAYSISGYARAIEYIQVSPWRAPAVAWVVVLCAVIVAVRFRQDPVLLAIVLLPQVLAILGYALFLGDIDHYYYLSLMPPVVLTVVLGLTSIVPTRARLVAIALLIVALAIVPARVRLASTLHKMPEYGVLVDASRRILRYGQPVREIRTTFTLPPTGDPEFIYLVLGGRLDRTSPWIAVVMSDGGVEYRKAGGS